MSDDKPQASPVATEMLLRRFGQLEAQFRQFGDLSSDIDAKFHDLRGIITQQGLQRDLAIRQQGADIKALAEQQNAVLAALNSLLSAVESVRGSSQARDSTIETQGKALLALTSRLDAMQEQINRVDEDVKTGLKELDRRMDNQERDLNDVLSFRIKPMTDYFYGDTARAIPSFASVREAELKQFGELTTAVRTMQTQVDVIISQQVERIKRARLRREQLAAGARTLWIFAQTRFGFAAISALVITVIGELGIANYQPIGDLIKHILQALGGS
ncbi:MAG: hypothetical protein OHK0046_46150 [Anaerolineae bacterium]